MIGDYVIFALPILLLILVVVVETRSYNRDAAAARERFEAEVDRYASQRPVREVWDGVGDQTSAVVFQFPERAA